MCGVSNNDKIQTTETTTRDTGFVDEARVSLSTFCPRGGDCASRPDLIVVYRYLQTDPIPFASLYQFGHTKAKMRLAKVIRMNRELSGQRRLSYSSPIVWLRAEAPMCC